MKSFVSALAALLFLAFSSCKSAQVSPPKTPKSLEKAAFSIQKTFHVASAGGWDYLAIAPDGRRLFVSHSTQVNILDLASGDSLGVVKNTAGVHGICFSEALQKGFTSNGRTNDVTVFDLKTGAETARFAAGQNPDFVQIESFLKKLITCNGRSGDLSVIDPASGKIDATIAVGGKPEEAVSDGKGLLFVNIEDKNEVVQVNLATSKVEKRWPLGDGKEPTGLVLEPKTGRLFVGCDELLVILDAKTGRKVAQIPIGAGCDGLAFDAKKGLIFTSNGEAGTMSVVRQIDAEHFEKLPDVPTKKGARTIRIDPATGLIYLPTADFEAQKAGETGRPKMRAGSFQVLVVGPN